jgi:hypothetical protein
MPSLHELQTAFGRALLDAGAANAADLGAIADDGLGAVARLRIYRHHVFTTLTEALAATFPVVRRLVDARFFAYAAARYIAEAPPAAPCLAEYGASFPDFLGTFPPCRHLAYLPEVARLEWALVAALHADDARPLEPASLGAVGDADAARLLLRLDPSITLLESPWPLDRLWRANQADAGDEATVDLAAGGVRLEIRRRGDDVVWRPLAPGAFALRRALADGAPLGPAAAAALAAESAFDLAAELRDLLDDAAVVGWELAPNPTSDTWEMNA